MSELLTLPYKTHGNKDSKILVVFLHGYPNTMRIWGDYLNKLEKDYFLVTLSYPNFILPEMAIDNKETRSDVVDSYWGISCDELIRRMKNTLDCINDTKRKVIYVGHDFGAFFGYVFDKENKDYFADMVMLDNASTIDKGFNLNFCIIFLYHIVFGICFLLGFPFGDLIIYLILKLGFKLDNVEAELISSRTCFLYFYLMKNVIISFIAIIVLNVFYFILRFNFFIYLTLTAAIVIYFYKSPKFAVNMKGYSSPKRLSFIYADDKFINFHSKRWVEKITALSNENDVIKVKGGHWFGIYNIDLIIDVIHKRIRKNLIKS